MLLRDKFNLQLLYQLVKLCSVSTAPDLLLLRKITFSVQTLAALSIYKFTRAVFEPYFSMRLGQLCLIRVKMSPVSAGGCNGGFYKTELCGMPCLRRQNL